MEAEETQSYKDDEKINTKLNAREMMVSLTTYFWNLTWNVSLSSFSSYNPVLHGPFYYSGYVRLSTSPYELHDDTITIKWSLDSRRKLSSVSLLFFLLLFRIGAENPVGIFASKINNCRFLRQVFTFSERPRF